MNADKIYLEDHPPARLQFYTTRNALPTGVIGVHTPENLPDVVGVDMGAESVARFIATRTDAAGSYHLINDYDSRIQLGRFEWTMFGARGYNTRLIHMSISGMADRWNQLPVKYVRGTLDQAALNARDAAIWLQVTRGLGVPAARLAKASVDARRRGFVAHGDLDPDRRHDPGDHFPWDDFLEAYSMAMGNAAPKADRLTEQIMHFQHDYNRLEIGESLTVDGLFGPKTRAALALVWRRCESLTEIIGEVTDGWAALVEGGV